MDGICGRDDAAEPMKGEMSREMGILFTVERFLDGEKNARIAEGG